MQEHFERLVPEACVEALVQMYTAEDEIALLGGQPDYVIDAIDNIDTKVALLAACNRRGIPVICVAGAGASSRRTSGPRVLPGLPLHQACTALQAAHKRKLLCYSSTFRWTGAVVQGQRRIRRASA